MTSSRLPQELGCDRRFDDRYVHGDHQYPDRRRLDGRHPGRDRCRHRRRRLDLDRLPGGRDRHHPAHRLALPGLLDAPLPDHERGAVPGLFRRLRLRTQSRADDRPARPAGLLRRRDDPDVLHPHHHAAAAGQAAGRNVHLRAGRHGGARDRPDDRRLAHRDLGLADHLLRQPGARRGDAADAVAVAGAQADAARTAAAWRLGRHRNHGAGLEHAADRAGGGQQGGLVRLAPDHPARRSSREFRSGCSSGSSLRWRVRS